MPCGDVVDASTRFGDPESLDALAIAAAVEEGHGRTLVLAYDRAVCVVAIVLEST